MPRVNRTRRRFAGVAGLVGATGLVGCLGDDAEEEEPDDDDVTDDEADVADDDADVDDGVIDDEDDDPAIERYGATAYYTRTRGPLPADIQYQHRGDPTPAWYDNRHQFNVASRSWADLHVYGELLSDWSYEPGMFEITFRDDVFWWSGDRVDAEDFVVNQTLDDWHVGGDDLEANPNIITYEVMDEQTVRISLADTWREEWAAEQAIVDEGIGGSAAFNQQWIETFEDTGGDMDAVEEVRNDLEEYDADSDEDLVHQLHIPFEFRLDGSLGDVGEDHWMLELVPEKDGTTRYRADEINFTSWYIGAEEEDIFNTERFMEEEQPYLGETQFLDLAAAEDIPFDYHQVGFARAEDQWGWTMNAEEHPTESPWFRRAWTFATDREAWEQPHQVPLEHAGHPFLSEDRLYHWVSEDVIEQMTTYGINAEWDRADEEMEIGGFERNADGMYLNQETGEPLEFTIPTQGQWMDYVEDLGSDWFADLEDWGIQAESVIDNGDQPYPIEASYVGGNIPEVVFDSVFGEDGLGWAAQDPNFDESVLAPAVGDADAPEEDWVEYDTRTMTDRLGVTIDDGPYQELVDQLAWVSNQLMPRTAVITHEQLRGFNDNRWHVSAIEEADPDQYLFIPEDRLWYNGLLSYVPEEER